MGGGLRAAEDTGLETQATVLWRGMVGQYRAERSAAHSFMHLLDEPSLSCGRGQTPLPGDPVESQTHRAFTEPTSQDEDAKRKYTG